MIRRAAIFSLFAATILTGGCRRNPIERLSSPLDDGAVPQTSGVYMLFDDELKTGGGVGFIPGGQNQSIDFTDHSAPRGAASVRYYWNGGDVFNDETNEWQHLFAGFSFVVTPEFSRHLAVPGKNLSGPGYSSLKMWVRGHLSEGTKLRIEGPGDGVGTPARVELDSLGSGWQEVTLPNIPSADFNPVNVFLTISFQYTQPPRTTVAGGGGLVFLDDIRYEN